MTTQNRVEKLALNNQIVKMRKDVKRARLWLINNLNHRIKRLNGSKAIERELEKNQSKVEKLRTEIQLLKHIDIDEVSKFALCNKQETLNQLADKNGQEVAQKVMLQLANHKFVQEQVKMFRQIYAVPMDRLILLVRSLGLQYQKKKNKSLQNTAEEIPHKEIEKERKLVQKKKVLENEKKIHSSEHKKISLAECFHDSLTEINSNLTLNVGIERKSEVEMDDSSSTIEVNALDKNRLHPISQPKLGNCLTDAQHNLEGTFKNEKISTSNPIVKKQTNRKENLNQKIPWPKLSIPQINKTIGTMIIKQLNLENEVDTISVNESHQNLDNSRDSLDPPRDSFFLGGVDLPSEGDSETKNDYNHLDSKRVHSSKTLGKKSSQNKTFCKMSGNTRELINGSTKIKQAIKTPPVSTPEVLHPSWQAKRKEKELQINIGGCHGKKIRFDDD